jgi:hypothetical protein
MSCCVVTFRLSGPSSARPWSTSSAAPQTKDVVCRFLATGGRPKQPTGRFVPRGQRKRTLAEADKKRIQKALEKKNEAPKKTEMWYDDKEKLWAYRKDKWGTAFQRGAPLIVIGCLLSYSPEANDFFYRYLSPLQVRMPSKLMLCCFIYLIACLILVSDKAQLLNLYYMMLGGNALRSQHVAYRASLRRYLVAYNPSLGHSSKAVSRPQIHDHRQTFPLV